MRRSEWAGSWGTLSAAALSLVVLAAALIYWGARPPAIDIRVEVEADLAAPEPPVLRCNGKPLAPVAVSLLGHRVKVTFDVPRPPLEDMMLWLGEPGVYAHLLSLRVYGPLGLPNYRLDGSRLMRLFRFHHDAGNPSGRRDGG